MAEIAEALDLKDIIHIGHSTHGEDDLVVPFETTGKVAATLLKNDQLISYPGFPHGIPFHGS